MRSEGSVGTLTGQIAYLRAEDKRLMRPPYSRPSAAVSLRLAALQTIAQSDGAGHGRVVFKPRRLNLPISQWPKPLLDAFEHEGLFG